MLFVFEKKYTLCLPFEPLLVNTFVFSRQDISLCYFFSSFLKHWFWSFQINILFSSLLNLAIFWRIHFLYILIVLKNIQRVIFFPLIYKHFNCVLVHAFVVYFNSIEKYADSQTHTHKIHIFFSERNCQWNASFMKHERKQCQKLTLSLPVKFLFLFL